MHPILNVATTRFTKFSVFQNLLHRNTYYCQCQSSYWGWKVRLQYSVHTVNHFDSSCLLSHFQLPPNALWKYYKQTHTFFFSTAFHVTTLILILHLKDKLMTSQRLQTTTYGCTTSHIARQVLIVKQMFFFLTLVPLKDKFDWYIYIFIHVYISFASHRYNTISLSYRQVCLVL